MDEFPVVIDPSRNDYPDDNGSTAGARVDYTIKEMPEDLRPRERLEYVGAGALSNAELLAITLRTGGQGENVIRLAERLLTTFHGLPGLLQASFEQLTEVHGLGKAKVTQIKAALELGRRLLQDAPQERAKIKNNELTGSIPAELGNLSNLRKLTVINNRLTGIIPATMGNLSNLRQLWLGNNQLTGSIPAELGNLFNLRRLYLRNNQLTGTIPPELDNLSNLRKKTFDKNKLTVRDNPQIAPKTTRRTRDRYKREHSERWEAGDAEATEFYVYILKLDRGRLLIAGWFDAADPRSARGYACLSFWPRRSGRSLIVNVPPL